MWAEFFNSAAGLAAFASIIVALLAVIAHIPPVAKRLRSMSHELCFWFSQRTEHERLEVLLHEIVGELKPNGGQSLRDSVNRIEDRLDFLGSFRRAQLNTDEVALCETDAHGNLCWANKRFITLMNVAERDLLNRGWVNIIHPDNRDWVLEHWLQAVDSEREFRERVHYQPHGEPDFWADVICHPVRSDSGKLFGYLAEVHPVELETKAQNES